MKSPQDEFPAGLNFNDNENRQEKLLYCLFSAPFPACRINILSSLENALFSS